VPTVLVTGTSRGIGRATALHLADTGWNVLAGVRRAEDGTKLQHPRITPLTLDVTSEHDLDQLEDHLPPTLDALVNNAGIVVGGPLEGVPLDELRRQLEVNVVAQVALTQRVLPRLRASRGRIVFVSSVSGRIATPMTGPYNASKFAIEGIADAWRNELKPWGIRVVLIEPAQTDTDMWQKAEQTMDDTEALLTPEHRQLYAKHIQGMRRTVPRSQRTAAPPQGVAETIAKALTTPRPKARYVVGRPAQVQATLAKLTPTPVLDAVLRLGTGVPRKP
jgi:NAD(P)-dependent dehydrogenase (short-subunit alcohol dehydrogenase family)